MCLLHAHFAPDAVIAMSIAKHIGVPLIATCHGSDVTVDDWHILLSGKISGWRYLLQRSALFEYGSKFIAVSDFLRERMIDVGYPQDKVVRHYVGVDTDRFSPNVTANFLFDGKPYILSVARHTEVKGLDGLIEAFSTIAHRYPDLELVQIGSGEQTAVLKARVAELGLESRVRFLGSQPPQKVLMHMQSCRLLVLSSRRATSGAEESFGLVLAEAGACGVPTVATRVGGISEAVAEGESGLLVDPDDPCALAAAMDTIIANPDVAAAMGRRGREFVRDCFDLHRQTKLLEQIYSEVI
jgi:glycosyltransferase involved in cell wall biosynthesis